MSYIIVVIIVYLFIAWLIAEEFYNIATMKGYKDRSYFWYCFLFGIAGYLMVVALPAEQSKRDEFPNAPETPKEISDENNTQREYIGKFPKMDFDDSSPLKQCPECGSCHDADLSVCPSCNHKYN